MATTPGGAADGDRAYVSRRKRRRTEPAAASPPGAAAFRPAAFAEDEAQEALWTRLERGIDVSGTDAPRAVYSFEALALPPPLLAALHRRGLRAPTDVQAQTLPAALRGRDVVALAPPGSGKTLSYLLPLLALALRVWHAGDARSAAPGVAEPVALVLTPSRELMSQVLRELLSFPVLPSAAGLQPVPAVGICGGVPVHEQLAQLQALAREPAAAVVATPGRLLHLLTMQTPRVLDLRRVHFLAIDEVDRMLEAELELQLRRILHACADNGAAPRQTLLVSATLPHFLDRLARSAVVDAITVRIAMDGRGSRAADAVGAVEHAVLFVRAAEKKARLLEALRATPRPPVLVFCNAVESVERVTRLLQSEQFHVASLHGEQTQAYRFQALAAFRDGLVDVLVATDLASRGLDFQDVDHVIIFDMPLSIEDYVHRCGRTGRRRERDAETSARAHARGKVTAFLTADCAIAAELKRLLHDAKQVIPRELELPSRFHPPAR